MPVKFGDGESTPSDNHRGQGAGWLRVYIVPKQSPRPPQRHRLKSQSAIPLGRNPLGDDDANRWAVKLFQWR